MNKILAILAGGLIAILIFGWSLPWITASPANMWGYRWTNGMLPNNGMHRGMMGGMMNGMGSTPMQGYDDEHPMHSDDHGYNHMNNQTQMYQECLEMMGDHMDMHHEDHHQEHHEEYHNETSDYEYGESHGGHC